MNQNARGVPVEWDEVAQQPPVRCGGCGRIVSHGELPPVPQYIRCKNSKCEAWNKVVGRTNRQLGRGPAST